MNILLTGGTGFIGRALCRELLDRGDTVTVFSRRPHTVRALCGDRVTPLDALQSMPETPFDAVINLAGEPIASRPWTQARRAVLRASRINLTRELCEVLANARQPPGIFISGSAVGFYGNGEERILDETATPRPDFAQALCADWEAEANHARFGARTCIVRIGLVMGNGGFLAPLLPLFKLGLGTRLGDGQQWMSWISHTDMVRVLLFLLDNPNAEGAFNATSPSPVTNREFTQTLAEVLNRPTFLAVPGFVLKTGLGDLSSLLLEGQRAIPERLVDLGFNFVHPDLKSALSAAVE